MLRRQCELISPASVIQRTSCYFSCEIFHRLPNFRVESSPPRVAAAVACRKRSDGEAGHIRQFMPSRLYATKRQTLYLIPPQRALVPPHVFDSQSMSRRATASSIACQTRKARRSHLCVASFVRSGDRVCAADSTRLHGRTPRLHGGADGGSLPERNPGMSQEGGGPKNMKLSWDLRLWKS